MLNSKVFMKNDYMSYLLFIIIIENVWSMKLYWKEVDHVPCVGHKATSSCTWSHVTTWVGKTKEKVERVAGYGLASTS